MRLNKSIATSLLLLVFEPALADDTLDLRAQYHLSVLINAQFSVELTKQLETAGLAATDVQVTVEDVVNKYAGCVISSLRRVPSPESELLINGLADGWTEDEMDASFEYLGDAERDEFFLQINGHIKTCAATVNQENGLVKK